MTTRDRKILAVLVVVGLVVGAWLLVIKPRQDQAAKLATQISGVQAQLSTARAQVAQGQAAHAEFARDYASLARLGEAVPADDNVPSLIVQLQAAATAAHVDFRSLALAGAGTSATTTSTGTTAGALSASLLPPGATVGPAGFPVEPFTFTFRGNFFHLANFFGRLERFVVATNKRVSISGRLITLDAISLQADSQGFPQIDATIAAETYLVPSAQGLLAGATSAGPSTAQPVSSSSGSSTSGGASATPTAVVTP